MTTPEHFNDEEQKVQSSLEEVRACAGHIRALLDQIKHVRNFLRQRNISLKLSPDSRELFALAGEIFRSRKVLSALCRGIPPPPHPAGVELWNQHLSCFDNRQDVGEALAHWSNETIQSLIHQELGGDPRYMNS